MAAARAAAVFFGGSPSDLKVLRSSPGGAIRLRQRRSRFLCGLVLRRPAAAFGSSPGGAMAAARAAAVFFGGSPSDLKVLRSSPGGAMAGATAPAFFFGRSALAPPNSARNSASRYPPQV